MDGRTPRRRGTLSSRGVSNRRGVARVDPNNSSGPRDRLSPFLRGSFNPRLSLSLSTIRGIHRIYRAGKKTNFHNCVTNSRRRIAGVLRYSTELLRMAQSGEREIRRVRNLRCYRTSMREMRHHFHQDFAIQLLSVEEKQRETVALIGR